MQDFYGFSFNGYHSSDMGFVRVSDGNRYNDTLVPSFQDKIVQIPGADGTYFFDSFYTQRPFTINIAFDEMTEEQLRTLRQVFNGKDVGQLIFDESPYKAYVVKLQSPPQLKYICFDKYNNSSSEWIHNHVLNPADPTSSNRVGVQAERVYKGEGTLQFVAYYPYAYSVHKALDDFSDCSNLNEWAAASHLKTRAQLNADYPDGDLSDVPSVSLYNAGDVPTDFKAYIRFADLVGANAHSLVLKLRNNNTDIDTLVLDFTKITDERNDASRMEYICIDTRTNLIEGYRQIDEPSGILYNDAIVSGDFFKIPVTNTGDNYTLAIEQVSGAQQVNYNIKMLEYNYLYY